MRATFHWQVSFVIAASRFTNLAISEPTYTHRAIHAMYKDGIVKHVVSQNCDGLHLRSGLPRTALSEIHGNMFIEVCSSCKMLYFRDFDVTERTGLRRHDTGRTCHKCPESKGNLRDTIVHFGEKGKLEWPLNWEAAGQAAEKADLIICLGSSLKILRRYPCLWPKKAQSKLKLVIVNLQWTPKDSQACLKINGKCDEVMQAVAKGMQLSVPEYKKSGDPLRILHNPLKPEEIISRNRLGIFSDESSASCSKPVTSMPGWFGKGLRVKKK